MVKLPPSTVSTVLGTSIGAVVAQLPPSVKVVPVRSPAHGPRVDGTASATPPTKMTGTATADSIAMKTKPASRRDLLRSEGRHDSELGKIVGTGAPHSPWLKPPRTV